MRARFGRDWYSGDGTSQLPVARQVPCERTGSTQVYLSCRKAILDKHHYEKMAIFCQRVVSALSWAIRVAKHQFL